jgi:hypothetical protein
MKGNRSFLKMNIGSMKERLSGGTVAQLEKRLEITP